MKEAKNMERRGAVVIGILLLLVAMFIFAINQRIGQGDIVSLGDLSAKRLFKSLDRAPELTIIAWGVFCAMLVIRITLWKKRKQIEK